LSVVSGRSPESLHTTENHKDPESPQFSYTDPYSKTICDSFYIGGDKWDNPKILINLLIKENTMEVPAQSKENIGHRACSYLYGPVDLRSLTSPVTSPAKLIGYSARGTVVALPARWLKPKVKRLQ
jgi:hypothetical protein